MDSLIQLLLDKGFNVTPLMNGEYLRFDRGGKTLNGWFRGWMIKDTHDQVLWMEAEFGDWVTREKHKWSGGKAECNLTAEELQEITVKRAEAEEAAKIEKLKRQELAAADANRLYASATPFDCHPYADRKGIEVRGLVKILGDKLCIPVFVDDKITSLQLIASDGSKKFLSGGRLDLGHSWWLRAARDHAIPPNPGTLFMCEGYATAASIGMALDQDVLVAFNIGNLVKLARGLPYKPDRVVICADNDGATKGNPGMVAAHEARDALVKQGIECRIVWPDFEKGVVHAE